MSKFYISDVVRAFEVLRELRDIIGNSPSPDEEDPLYPSWVKSLEFALDDMTKAYTLTVKKVNEAVNNQNV